MALFDDRRFLLSHINHSFITGDDTGICEVVMLDEDVFENQHQQCLRLQGQSEDDSPEQRLDPQAYDLNYESELFESEHGQSYDIASDLEYISHRRRSNTAQRLDRLKKDKKNQSKTRTIVWRVGSPTNSRREDRSLQSSPTQFEQTATNAPSNENGIGNRKSKSPPKKSGLTKLLERYPSLPKNPFNEFAQFDGGMSEVVPVKKIMIFIAINSNSQQQVQIGEETQPPNTNPNNLESQSNQTTNDLCTNTANGPASKTTAGLAETNLKGIQQQRGDNNNGNNNAATETNNDTDNIPETSTAPYSSLPAAKSSGPLEVVIVSTAKVQDLIGLICWQFTNEGREPKLNPDISKYCLRIAEDNGEVDPDFTSLNPKEPLSKFNFPSLALTLKTEERTRPYNEQDYTYTNGSVYTHRVPSITQNVVTTGHKISSASSRLAALTRIIFKDAKLDANQ